MQDRFKVDYIVSVDNTFGCTRQPMKEYMAKYATPNINRWSWADYRIPEWMFNGDSGMTAVAVAAMLGGYPVIALGIDRLSGDRRYFWQTTPEGGWARRAPNNVDNVRVNVARTVAFCQDSLVFGTGGPMRAYWPVYDPDYAKPGNQRPPPFVHHEAPQMTLKGKWYTSSTTIFIHPSDPVSGAVLLTDQEAKAHLHRKHITIVAGQ
jgi:hypothetical protein